MLNLDKILSCAVIVMEKQDNTKSICAYFTAKEEVDIKEIRDYLQKALPKYMVPAYFVQMEGLPYTPNGKIDRKKLRTIIPTLTSHEEDDVSGLTKEELIFVEIWKDLLKLEHISVNDDFFEIGGNSLLAINLQINAMKSGIDIKYKDIFKYKTIRNILKKDDTNTYKLELNHYDYSDINQLIQENSVKNIPPKLKKQKIGNIFLTGATGFLGAHILDKFLQEEEGKVYCLIRGKTLESCKERLVHDLEFYFGNKYTNEIDNRIQVLNGDITNERLKLNGSTLQLLFNEITTVVHAASLVKHYGNESDFLNININGVKNVINFCKIYNKKLVYISTISVAGIVDNTSVFSERNLYISQKTDNLYIYSKFMAERAVLENILDGLDAIIIRPGNILNRYTDFKFQKNFKENRFINELKSFIGIRRIPDSLKNKDIEISPVDYLSTAIIRLLQHPSKANIFNLINVNTIKLYEMIEILKELNINIRFVENVEFEKLIGEMIQKDENNDILSGFINHIGNKINIDIENDTSIDASFTKQYLSTIGFNWLLLDENYIKNIIKYFHDIDYFNY